MVHYDFTKREREIAENGGRSFRVREHESARNTFIAVLPGRRLEKRIQFRNTAIRWDGASRPGPGGRPAGRPYGNLRVEDLPK